MIVWVPTARVEIWKVAIPAAFTVLVPSVFAPSEKVTVPVGTTEPTAASVMVKTTLLPETEGFRLDVSVAPAACTISSLITVDVDGAWLVSPL